MPAFVGVFHARPLWLARRCASILALAALQCAHSRRRMLVVARGVLPTPLRQHSWDPSAPPSSLLKYSTGCVIARIGSQHSGATRYFASRAEFSSALGEVEECHYGIFQRTVSVGSTKMALVSSSANAVRSYSQHLRSWRRPGKPLLPGADAGRWRFANTVLVLSHRLMAAALAIPRPGQAGARRQPRNRPRPPAVLRRA